MSEIDPVPWQPATHSKVDIFLGILAAVDIAVIVLAFWYFHAKG